MADEDPSIKVHLDEKTLGIAIRIYDGEVILSTRSALDLHAKLGKVLLDWIRDESLKLLETKRKNG